MPRRWLSVKQKKENSQSAPANADADNNFEFAFRAECGLQDKKDEGCELRPTTSGGERYRSKRKPDLSLLIERPKSSDSVLHSTPRSTRFRDSQIGLALGSPCHPPEAFTNIDVTMSPKQQRHAFSQDGPLPVTYNMKSKKWKLGGLFRSKSNVTKESFYNVKLTSPEANKLGLPIHSTRTPWRNPKSPLVVQNGFESPPPMPISKELPISSEHDIDSIHKAEIAATPTLEVSIPDSPLERYSVMFKGVNGLQQSRLLVRRSKGVNQLVIAEEQLEIPVIARRATSPTTSSPVHTSQASVQGPNSSKYSLFPTTPTSCIMQAARDSPRSTRNRSVTAPSLTCSPVMLAKAATSCHSQSETVALSGTQCLEAVKPVPQRTTSQHSRGSSQSEIFFDIRSFRDSKGQEGHQLVRPPSAAVQLARSKSNARKVQQKQRDGPQPEKVDEDEREIKTTSIEIDETIALVESLTSPSTNVNGTASIRIDQTDAQPILQCLPKTQYKTSSTALAGRRKESSRCRIEALNIDVPSPVLESTEELTPKVVRPDIQARKHEAPTNITTIVQVNSKDSPVIPASPPRPAPPVKDHKHIPLSKYAPRSTTTELINNVGLRPVRPGRSHTATSNPHEDRTSSLQRPQHPTRSATVPLSEHQTRTSNLPQSKYTRFQPVVAGPTTNERTMPVMVAYVKPAAEVSVARTVSLSRKPSAAAKVTVTQLSRTPSTNISKHIPNDRQPPIHETEHNVESKLHIGRVDSLSKKHERIKESVEENKKEVNLGTPVLQQVHSRHKPGRSMDVVLETASDTETSVPPVPASPPPPVPVPSPFEIRMGGQMVACS